MGFYGCAWKQKQPSKFIIFKELHVKEWNERLDCNGISLWYDPFTFVITIGDFYNAIQTNRPPDKDVINLLSMAITGIVGIIAGFISGKNAADQAKQQSEAAAGATKWN